METLVERCANEGVATIAKELGCSDKSIYYLLKGRTPSNKGGKVARTIPAHEIVAKPVDAEMREIAEKNEQNACVVMKKCVVELSGSCGSYEINTGNKCVWITPNGCDGDGVEVKLKDLPGFVEELKAVCRCAQSYDMGNAMW
jgi:hypothetical protein